MVSFQCESCGDTVKKPKLDQHHARCYAPFVCIDCSTTFQGPAEWKGHTTCISEAEKYQKGLYKGPKPVGPKPVGPKPNGPPSQNDKRPANHQQPHLQQQQQQPSFPGKYSQAGRGGFRPDQFPPPHRGTGANLTPLGTPRRMSPVSNPPTPQPAPEVPEQKPAAPTKPTAAATATHVNGGTAGAELGKEGKGKKEKRERKEKKEKSKQGPAELVLNGANGEPNSKKEKSKKKAAETPVTEAPAPASEPTKVEKSKKRKEPPGEPDTIELGEGTIKKRKRAKSMLPDGVAEVVATSVKLPEEGAKTKKKKKDGSLVGGKDVPVVHEEPTTIITQREQADTNGKKKKKSDKQGQDTVQMTDAVVVLAVEAVALVGDKANGKKKRKSEATGDAEETKGNKKKRKVDTSA